MFFLFAVLVIIQFFHPAKNDSKDYTKDIANVYPVSDTIKKILEKACNDCHSNSTNYPWYSNFQPVAWWLQDHINEGKNHLNFSVFATYSLKRQAHKLHEVAEIIEEEEMPLSSYTLIHKEAILTKEEKNTFINWAKSLSHQINPNQTEKEERD